MLELFAVTIVFCIALGFWAGLAVACYRLRGQGTFGASVRRVFGLAELGGPDDGNGGPR